jgi:polysaccharide biosynthesis protein PslL
MVTPRYKQIDIAKGIGILFVVLGHNWVAAHGKGELFKVIYSFHVPLFFFLSGLVMNFNNSFIETLIKKSDSYLKPYYIACFIAGLFIVLYEKNNPINYLIRIVYGNGLVIPWKWVPLWFLPHLWAVSLFSYLFYRLGNFGSRSTTFKVIFLISILFIGYMGIDLFMNVQLPSTNMLLPGLPFNIDLILVTSFFFLLGRFIKQSVIDLKFSGPMLVIAVFVFSLMHFTFESATELNMRRYDNVFISTFEALIGIYIILSISVFVEGKKIVSRLLSHIGMASLFIMSFHFIIQQEAFSLLSTINGQQYIIICAIASFLLAVFIPLFFYEVVCRHITLRKIFLPMKYAVRQQSVTGSCI